MTTKTKAARDCCHSRRAKGGWSNTATSLPHQWTLEQCRAIEIAMVAFAALLIALAVMGA